MNKGYQEKLAQMVKIQTDRNEKIKKQVEDQTEVQNLMSGKNIQNPKQYGKMLEAYIQKNQGKHQKISLILNNSHQVLNKMPKSQHKNFLKPILSMKNIDQFIGSLKSFNQRIYQEEREEDYKNRITQSENTNFTIETKSKNFVRKKTKIKNKMLQDEEGQSVLQPQPQVQDLVNYELLQDGQSIGQQYYSSSLKDDGIDIVYIPQTLKDILGYQIPWNKIAQLLKKSRKARKQNQSGVKDLKIKGRIMQELKFLGEYGDFRLFGIVHQVNNKKVLMFRKQGNHKTELKEMVRSLENMQKPNLELRKIVT